MNLLTIIITFLELTFFGLLIAFNPLLLVSELAIVLRSKQPIFHALVFAVGAITPLVLIGVVGSFMFNEQTQVQSFDISIRLSPVLDFLIGTCLALIGIRILMFTRKSAPKKSARTSKKAHSSSVISLFAFAFFRSAMSFTSIIGIVAATKVLKSTTDNYLWILLGLFWAISVGVSPFVGLIGYSVKRPDSVRALEQRIDPFLNKDYRPLLGWISLVVGGYFLLVSLF